MKLSGSFVQNWQTSSATTTQNTPDQDVWFQKVSFTSYFDCIYEVWRRLPPNWMFSNNWVLKYKKMFFFLLFIIHQTGITNHPWTMDSNLGATLSAGNKRLLSQSINKTITYLCVCNDFKMAKVWAWRALPKDWRLILLL